MGMHYRMVRPSPAAVGEETHCVVKFLQTSDDSDGRHVDSVRTAGGECAVERFKYSVILAAGSGHSQSSYSPIGDAMRVQNRIP